MSLEDVKKRFDELIRTGKSLLPFQSSSLDYLAKKDTWEAQCQVLLEKAFEKDSIYLQKFRNALTYGNKEAHITHGVALMEAAREEFDLEIKSDKLAKVKKEIREEKPEAPFIPITIQNIQGDVNAPVIQAVRSEFNFNQQVTESFKQVQIIVENREGISPKLKEEIREQLRLLQEELTRQEPNLGNIQKLWKWLKQNASWIVPTLTSIVMEGIKIAMG